MFTISKTFTFEAAHRIHGHPKCGHLHGHSYRVMVELTADDAPGGMVLDYGLLYPIKLYIDEHLDHRYIVSIELVKEGDKFWKVCDEAEHVVLPVEQSTAECLARFFYDKFKDEFPLSAVTVCETASTTATYRP